MFLAICSGEVGVHEIAKYARRFGNRALSEIASKYGPRSLDAEIGEDGFTLLDTMKDEGSSSWLEEMGATAW